MSKNIEHLQHIKSNVVIEGKPKLPTAEVLVEGELAVNYAEGYETISLRNSSSDITTFSSDDYYTKKKLGSGFTGDNSANTVTSVIEENEEVVAYALNDLNSRKLDASAYTPTDLSNYYTKSETSGATELAIAFDNKADKTAVDDLSGQSETIAAALNDLNNRKLDVSAYTPITSGDIQTQIDESLLMELTNGHDYVEIGGLKWATMNIGANSITDTGLYFQWGDTQGYTASQVGSGEGQKYFGWADYKYGNGTSSPGATGMTKYNATDGKTVLEAVDDAAVANWGGSWRMPTTAEFQALGAATTSAWTTDYQGSGVSGLVLTDKTDSSKTLFFPAAGYCYNGSVNNEGSHGNYWSSSVYSSDVQRAYNLNFNSSNVNGQDNSNRLYGFAVRPVFDGEPSSVKDVVSDIVTSLDGKVGVDEYEADSRAIAIAFNDINNTIGDIETLLAAI